jgi:hypothetical protein
MAASVGGCDDPMHPPLRWPQEFENWRDFTHRVCLPIVEADSDHGGEKVQAAMRLYRTASPYSIAVSLVMALNRVEALEKQWRAHDDES